VNRQGLAVLIGLGTLVFCVSGSAGDEPWGRYENRHFVAFSNAPAKKALGLLEGLESFRGAFLQVGNVEIPADAPKTKVLILANKKEFQKLASNKLHAGFAASDGRTTVIVMPGDGDKGWARTVIRHEYGHALLRFKKFNYPSWYEEGFAELVSSTEVVNKGQSFTIGQPPDRARHNGPPLYDWDELVSDEFNPHAITNRELGSSAYSQAWLLAHYATLGNELKNAQLLQKYFNRLKDGESQGVAFEESFGAPASQLWLSQLKAYTKQIPGYTIPYKPGVVDLAFASSPGAGAELDGIFKYLRAMSEAKGDASPPQDVLASLSGRWAPIRIGMACEEYNDMSLNRATKSFTIVSTMGRSGQNPESAIYRYELSDDGTVRLEFNDPAGDDAAGGEAISLKHRTNDLLCMGANSVAAAECTQALHRCGS
jgi:hypothetical protein